MIWKYRPIDPVRARSLAVSLGQPLKFGEYLTARGFSTPKEATDFLSFELSRLPAPETLPGLTKAVGLFQEARDKNKVVAIAGDYDVDGLTATALLTRFLTAYGFRAISRIPNRLSEGYGLSAKGVEELIDRGAELLVTVDCGVSDVEAIEAANKRGMTVVVTDHHELPPRLPPAAAILNPHLGGGWEKYPLAGVGVAFVLAWGLKNAFKAKGLASPKESLVECLALVALGSIADLAPLRGPNRILVWHGLNFLARIDWPGLAALRRKALKSQGFVTTRDVGFRLAPRLNAAGRLGQADLALRLLMSTDPDEARDLAETLEGLNRTRLSDQNALLEEALEVLAEEYAPLGDFRTVVLAGKGWPRGLLGLAASRVVEATNRPTVILALEGDMAVGSGRSVRGFNLFAALEPLRDLCVSMGGHAQAAGLKIKKELLPRFKEALERSAANQAPPEPEPLLDVDLVAGLADLSAIAPPLAEMEPFGNGNPSPVVVLKNVRVLEAVPTRTGGDQHMMLRLFDGTSKVSLVGFGLAPRLHEIGSRLDVAVILETERFGRKEPHFRLIDFKQPDV
ncbi:MAG: single-stranded-DNA-specific exonuclease RecJ [Deltaproteobacteria bacterium]|nr:single-stranded-DNA-specific exonuclease RecJ [Deltaproteobacteria bacterium]